ncbi:MAG: hypothetical protein JST26_05230 [Bacteroidetes bacterium]|nr:hypothetical protein [Bacteroidota bacterium]
MFLFFQEKRKEETNKTNSFSLTKKKQKVKAVSSHAKIYGEAIPMIGTPFGQTADHRPHKPAPFAVPLIFKRIR